MKCCYRGLASRIGAAEWTLRFQSRVGISKEAGTINLPRSNGTGCTSGGSADYIELFLIDGKLFRRTRRCIEEVLNIATCRTSLAVRRQADKLR